MSRTANVFARVEPEVKTEAETVLGELGIPMSNAIGMFLKQVALQRGIPFEVKLPSPAPLALRDLTKTQLDSEIQEGLDDIEAGRTAPADEVEKHLRTKLGIAHV